MDEWIATVLRSTRLNDPQNVGQHDKCVARKEIAELTSRRDVAHPSCNYRKGARVIAIVNARTLTSGHPLRAVNVLTSAHLWVTFPQTCVHTLQSNIRHGTQYYQRSC
jgi:hypothetical protein